MIFQPFSDSHVKFFRLIAADLRGIFKKNLYARREFASSRRLRIMAVRREFASSRRECVNEEINEANWMVSNSAKLDRRTKQHTQVGVSPSNGSRDMARTKSWRKKQKTKLKK